MFGGDDSQWLKENLFALWSFKSVLLAKKPVTSIYLTYAGPRAFVARVVAKKSIILSPNGVSINASRVIIRLPHCRDSLSQDSYAAFKVVLGHISGGN
jgi:hypothetical protein